MATTKKFLDSAGISYFWSLINNKYIDSDELTTVVNAIDETKLDKSGLTNITNNEIDEICNPQE